MSNEKKTELQNMNYADFLEYKSMQSIDAGFECEPENENLFDFQRDIVRWALRKGRAALFLDTGLGKTLCQLSWAYEVCKHVNGKVLIVAPLAVSKQTQREGEKFGIAVNICRTQRDVKDGISITNYEMLSHFKASEFIGIVLDESSILKHTDSMTRQYITDAFSLTPYKLCCTATPAPNDFMELGNHSEFLGVMTRSEMLSTYFVHDGSDTSQWRLKGHAENKFWEWIASWGSVLQNPRDLGYDGSNYDLPELQITEHLVDSNLFEYGKTKGFAFMTIALTLNDRRKARNLSLEARVKCAADIANSIEGQVLVWCDLNAESELLTKSIKGAVELAGKHSNDYKVEKMLGFSTGKVRVLVTKPSIAGWGMNWQNCNNMIFVGLSDSFEAYYQAVRRCWRYGQKKQVDVHIITARTEGAVLENIKRKQKNAQIMTTELIKRTKDILKKEIIGAFKITEDYNAGQEMKLPFFLGEQ